MVSRRTCTQVPPTVPALPIRKLHGQHRASTVPVDADGDLHGLSPDHVVGADLLVPHVQNQVAAGELLQIAVEPLVDPADTGCRKPMGRESSRTTSSGPSRPPKTSAMGNQLAAFTLHVLFSHADQTGSCEIGQRYPPGTGSAQIRRSMSPNSRRFRYPSASSSQ